MFGNRILMRLLDPKYFCMTIMLKLNVVGLRNMIQDQMNHIFMNIVEDCT